jgi:hypothetical protein
MLNQSLYDKNTKAPSNNIICKDCKLGIKNCKYMSIRIISNYFEIYTYFINL